MLLIPSPPVQENRVLLISLSWCLVKNLQVVLPSLGIKIIGDFVRVLLVVFRAVAFVKGLFKFWSLIICVFLVHFLHIYLLDAVIRWLFIAAIDCILAFWWWTWIQFRIWSLWIFVILLVNLFHVVKLGGDVADFARRRFVSLIEIIISFALINSKFWSGLLQRSLHIRWIKVRPVYTLRW